MDEDVEVVVALIEVLLDTVVIVEDDKGLATPADEAEQGEVKEGLRQLVDPFSLLGVARRSSLETASIRSAGGPPPSVCLGEEPEVVTSGRPLVLESGIEGESKFNSVLLLVES